ncbi:DUF1963 domain-containing protein [Paenibacillus sp. D2_2]|uniref:DUF1963 domain-containing protein n=1 Tax=Paenibacillus sp. D2_2 TaxID=3073092 RepID=UPI00281525BF|nr:DUF1963 domain-containing protein [Paenibacillus sp. D2_2]WMT43292.1 DUF1963 domain-containing protein [Paenibacillus sp. D2_2]
MEILKRKIMRQATLLQIGGFRPSGELTSSIFGKVNVSLPNEEWPSSNNKPMIPLCQINIIQLPYIPVSLKDIEMITLFIDSNDLPDNNPNGQKWCLRAYKYIKDLVPIQSVPYESNIKVFEMKPTLIEEDYPCWDDFVEELSKENIPVTVEINDFYNNHLNNVSGLKVGGWPTTIQSEIYWAPYNQHPVNPQFVFQIDSTDKGNWFWGDNGVGYIGRGTTIEGSNEWVIEWQCF